MNIIQTVLFVSIAYIALGEPSQKPTWQPVLYLDMTKRVLIGQNEELRTLGHLEGAMYEKKGNHEETDFLDVVGILSNGVHSVQSESVNTALEGTSFFELNKGLPLVFTVNETILAIIGPKHPKDIVIKLNYNVWAKTNQTETSAV